ncbi:hypothetical protein B0T25DRAFT_170470 [Lasiosphaeria hispida]|uniref:Uncharacterized protein n=1 Tax=Lasiosphaeria hispida TaxID=260671 RepID=A0AAJ0HMV9_9PEZI|nr:hypothetical protein B0T25DRAFT_170470 [Lasiosphaeria hispida]
MAFCVSHHASRPVRLPAWSMRQQEHLPRASFDWWLLGLAQFPTSCHLACQETRSCECLPSLMLVTLMKVKEMVNGERGSTDNGKEALIWLMWIARCATRTTLKDGTVGPRYLEVNAGNGGEKTDRDRMGGWQSVKGKLEVRDCRGCVSEIGQ